MNDERFQILDMRYHIPRFLAADFRMNRYHGRHRSHICLYSGHENGLPANPLRRLTSPGHFSRILAVNRRTYRDAH
jgi:hypothetical protein